MGQGQVRVISLLSVPLYSLLIPNLFHQFILLIVCTGHNERLPGTLGIKGIKWNFTKFLIDADGRPVARFGPPTDPKSIEPAIVQLLKCS